MIAAPEKGIGSIITDGSAGGFFARRLLPTSILLPFVIGYFRVQGERAGLFGSYFGVAIVATIYIVAFGIAVLWSAGLVARSEAMKKLADNSAREAEERYKALYESSRDAIMTLEPYGRFLGGNRAAIQLFGCKDEKEFTADVVQMVAVGEETGNIDGMLNKIADFYDMTVNYAVKKLTTIIEPVFLVIMGIIVGTIMASMLLPIFDMVKTMRR
jgi:PAS domain-containing protein